MKWLFGRRLRCLAVYLVQAVVVSGAWATAGDVNMRANLRTGQPWVQASEFEGPPSKLRLTLTRHWVPHARTHGQLCTWGAHWCVAADDRLLLQADGSLLLNDCCTQGAIVWKNSVAEPHVWRSPLFPDAQLLRQDGAPAGMNAKVVAATAAADAPEKPGTPAFHFELRWDQDETTRVDFYSADGRLIRQSARAYAGAEPEWLVYEWEPRGATAQEGQRLQSVRHSKGTVLTFQYNGRGVLSQLLHGGKAVRHYRYDEQGRLLAAASDAQALSAPDQQYAYGPQGGLLAWPGGKALQDWHADPTNGFWPQGQLKWTHRRLVHVAQAKAVSGGMQVTHTWGYEDDGGHDKPPSPKWMNHNRLLFSSGTPYSPWPQTAVEVACALEEPFVVHMDAKSGKPVKTVPLPERLGTRPSAKAMRETVTYAWRPDGQLSEMVQNGVVARHLYNAQGRHAQVRHQLLAGAKFSPEITDLDFTYDPKTGEISGIELLPPAGTTKKGGAVPRTGLRMVHEEADPTRLKRVEAYGGVAADLVKRANAVWLPEGIPPSASDLSAQICRQ